MAGLRRSAAQARARARPVRGARPLPRGGAASRSAAPSSSLGRGCVSNLVIGIRDDELAQPRRVQGADPVCSRTPRGSTALTAMRRARRSSGRSRSTTSSSPPRTELLDRARSRRGDPGEVAVGRIETRRRRRGGRRSGQDRSAVPAARAPAPLERRTRAAVDRASDRHARRARRRAENRRGPPRAGDGGADPRSNRIWQRRCSTTSSHPRASKIAHGASDLATFAHVDQSQTRPGSQRTRARADPATGRRNGSAAAWYEIYHDVLAGAVLDWRADTSRRSR